MKTTTATTNDNTAAAVGGIPPFAVCTDVDLGPLLPPIAKQDEFFRKTWAKVQKNKSSSDPNKTVKPEYRGRWGRGESPSSSKKPFQMPTRVEACSAIPGNMKEDQQQPAPKKEGNNNDNKNSKTQNNCRVVPVFGQFDSINLLAQTVHTAFYRHYPLRLGPDAIWLTILQGLAKHIDKDPEGQRKNFVNFDGKQTLVVIRPDFVKGSPNNDWTTVFPEFAAMIQSYVGKDKVSAMTCDFTTSSTTDRICSHIALMDTVKHYFEYEMMCGCGIPSIELAGTPDDWVRLREKANVLNQFNDLEWWTEELFPVLDHFVEAAKGNPDIKFWKSVCNLYGLSGFFEKFVTGWVQVFFPYTTRGERCRGLGQWRKNYECGTGNETADYNRGVLKPERSWDFGHDFAGYGLDLENIPVGVSQAPFVYTDVSTGHKYDMTFNGGIVAIVQNTETKALEPVTGWAVLDHGMILD